MGGRTGTPLGLGPPLRKAVNSPVVHPAGSPAIDGATGAQGISARGAKGSGGPRPSGVPVLPPMPPYAMSDADAMAVTAYIASLPRGTE